MAWKELRQIITEYERSEGPFTLATLVKSSGSTYRQPGSRMLILQGRPCSGRMSAGCIEDEIADLGQAVILSGKPARCSFDLRSRFACDGSIEVFIERLAIMVSTDYRLNGTAGGTRLLDGPLAHHAEEYREQIQPPIRLIIFGEY